MVEEVTSKGFTDYHCHILPSIDDGPSTIEESFQMARTLEKLGFKKIYCTPHLIKGIYETTLDCVITAVSNLQEKFALEGVDITLHAGFEYRLDEYLLGFLEEVVTLSDNMILCELPSQINPNYLLNCIYHINRKGFRTLVAHPERNQMFADNFELLYQIQSMDCLFQCNIKSFAGSYGNEIKERAIKFLKKGLCYCVASDAHKSTNLEYELNAGISLLRKLMPDSYLNLLGINY